MKHNIFIVVVITACLSIVAWVYLDMSDSSYAKVLPTQVDFIDKEISLGKLKQGVPQTVKFPFKNVGEYPLFIGHVETTCGCTEVKCPKKPIKQGGEGILEVTYDAKHYGHFIKSLKVFCNTQEGVVTLRINGSVAYDEDTKKL